jgi:hypothetical protein
MSAHLDPGFLVDWIRSELDAADHSFRFPPLVAKGIDEGLDEAEAELDAAGQIAERTGWLAALEQASGDLWLAAVHRSRGPVERLERSGDSSVVASLRPEAGAAARLRQLSALLERDPALRTAELPPVSGGTPGCAAGSAA